MLWECCFVKQHSFFLDSFCESCHNKVALVIIPMLLFLLSGSTLRHMLLIIIAIIFGVGHIYVTYVNAKLSEE